MFRHFFHAMILNIIEDVKLDAVNGVSRISEIKLQLVKMIPKIVMQSLKKLKLDKYNQSAI